MPWKCLELRIRICIYMEKKLISVQWFKALGLVFLIQEPSLMSQEGDRTDILPWIALQVCFQYWSFSWKFQVFLWLFCAASSLLALGLHYICMCEGFRLKKSHKNLCIHDLQDLIFQDLFKYFFMPIWYKSWPIDFNSFYIWSCTNF